MKDLTPVAGESPRERADSCAVWHTESRVRFTERLHMNAPAAQISIVRPEPSVAVVVFAGEHDLTSAKDATRVFEELAGEGTSIVADLSQVSFLDTTIIHALVVGRNLAESAGIGFAICLPEG